MSLIFWGGEFHNVTQRGKVNPNLIRKQHKVIDRVISQVEQTNPVRGRRKAKIQVQPKKSHTYKEINNNTMREHEESHKLQCSPLMLEMQEIQNKLVSEECMAGRIGTGEGYWVIVNKFKEQHGWGGGVQSQRKEN